MAALHLHECVGCGLAFACRDDDVADVTITHRDVWCMGCVVLGPELVRGGDQE
jgi:hypothetical protein